MKINKKTQEKFERLLRKQLIEFFDNQQLELTEEYSDTYTDGTIHYSTTYKVDKFNNFTLYNNWIARRWNPELFDHSQSNGKDNIDFGRMNSLEEMENQLEYIKRNWNKPLQVSIKQEIQQ